MLYSVLVEDREIQYGCSHFFHTSRGVKLIVWRHSRDWLEPAACDTGARVGYPHDIPSKVAQPQFTKLLGSSGAFLLPHGCRMLGLVPIPEIADAAQR